MHVRMSSLIKGGLACLLVLSFLSVVHAVEDPRFTLKDGVIYDSKLRLQWAPANGQAMDQHDAENYARNLTLAGGGWRLPTRDELKSLYDTTKSGRADPVFNINQNWVWTAELNGQSDAWYFDFESGGVSMSSRDSRLRVLAVRSQREIPEPKAPSTSAKAEGITTSSQEKSSLRQETPEPKAPSTPARAEEITTSSQGEGSPQQKTPEPKAPSTPARAEEITTSSQEKSSLQQETLEPKTPSTSARAEGITTSSQEKGSPQQETLEPKTPSTSARAEEITTSSTQKPSTYTAPTTDMEFVFVKGGCYQMGDTFGDGYGDEKPAHEVCVDDFYIGKYDVTQGQWQEVMGNNPSLFKNCGDNCPVEMVSWNDAQEFITKLNKRSGGKKYRLPTEAEWEYAARSGGKREKYAGSDDVDSVAWCGSNSDGSTHPVGTKSPNGLGIYDMNGNVWQWVQDWYGANYYSKSTRKNPRGPGSGSDRVIRGGSWNSGLDSVWASLRGYVTPDVRGSLMGFRLLRTP